MTYLIVLFTIPKLIIGAHFHHQLINITFKKRKPIDWTPYVIDTNVHKTPDLDYVPNATQNCRTAFRKHGGRAFTPLPNITFDSSHWGW